MCRAVLCCPVLCCAVLFALRPLHTSLTALAFVALGWNKFEDLTVPPAQYVRLTHSGSTPFDLVELRFYGYVLNSTDGVDCAVDVSVNTTDTTAVATATLAAAVTYASGSTPVVTAISPASGTAAGAQTVVLTGTGFTSPQSLVTVKIDGIDCVVQSSTGTSITCITGYRPAIVPDALGMVVWIAGVGEAALQCSPYMYIDPWSSPLTWRDGLPPVDGDLVVLPKGRNVLLDIDTPKLLYLLIEGTLIVDDTQVTPPLLRWGQRACDTGSRMFVCAIRWGRGGCAGPFRAPSQCPATVPLTASARLDGICNRQ